MYWAEGMAKQAKKRNVKQKSDCILDLNIYLHPWDQIHSTTFLLHLDVWIVPLNVLHLFLKNNVCWGEKKNKTTNKLGISIVFICQSSVLNLSRKKLVLCSLWALAGQGNDPQRCWWYSFCWIVSGLPIKKKKKKDTNDNGRDSRTGSRNWQQ